MNPGVQPSGITACILAGGQGRRMGGIDKGLLEWQGRPLIEHLLRAIEPQVGAVLINANRNPDAYRRYGHPLARDQLEGYQGPLAGIAACMSRADSEYIVTLPCDGPRLPSDYIARLTSALARGDNPIAVAHDGERLQPVHALLPIALLPDLKAFLDSGQRKVDIWYSEHGYTPADFSDRPGVFANINRPEDRERLRNQETIR